MTSEIWEWYQADGSIPAESALARVTEKDICLCSQTGCLSDPTAAEQQKRFCYALVFFRSLCSEWYFELIFTKQPKPLLESDC